MPDYTPTRRELIASTIGLTTAGSAILLTTTEPTSAASLSGEFTIPDVDKQVTNPVNGFRLNATANISWEADTTPTKAILRLEVARSGAFQQLAATTLPDLKQDYSHEHEFERVNLFNHDRISVAEINPTEIGETESLELQARLKLHVLRDGQTLAREELTEGVRVEVTRGVGSVVVSLGAGGEVVIETSD
jgi:hypothetical protein